MIERLRKQSEGGQPIKPETKSWIKRAATASALTGLAVFSYLGERRGWMNDWDGDLRSIGESCAHPVLGYIGAWAGTTIARQHLPGSKKVEYGALAIGTGSVNFGTEMFQDLLSDPAVQAGFLATANRMETAKDAAFAAAGALLYLAQNRSSAET